MKDYSEMSDFEVNKAVAISIWDTDFLVLHGEFDPCNSWADAGPIIEKQRITIAYDGEEKSEHPCAWVNVSSIDNLHAIKYQHPEKTLRAAMIVFLMMQESK